MADDTLDIRETLPFEATTRPYGTFYNYDMEALSQDQQEYLNRVKLCVLRDQHRYLNRHPEVGVICKLLLSECLYRKPKSVLRFAAEFCKDDYRGETLKRRVDRYLEIQKRAKERDRKMNIKVSEAKKSYEKKLYSFKPKVQLRFEEKIQKMRFFLQTFPPKELPSRIHLPHDYYDKLQRMLKDLSRVHPTYRYTKKDEYQMTYEHICDVLKVDLRQLGLDVGDEIKPCKLYLKKKEVPKRAITTRPKPDLKEKIKFLKCHFCFNRIDSESPGFESELCSQCWFWHQAKESKEEETIEKIEPTSVDQVSLSPCDSCVSCLKEEKPIEKKESEDIVVKEQVEDEEEDLGDQVALEESSLSSASDVDKMHKESVRTKTTETSYFVRREPKQKVDVVELIRQWMVEWKEFMNELDLARENGLISDDSYIYLRYFKEKPSETGGLDRKEEDQEEAESVKNKSSRSSGATYKVSKTDSEFIESIFIEGEEEIPTMFTPYHRSSSSSSEDEPLEVQASRPADDHRCNKCKQCLEGKICLTEAQQRDRNIRLLFDVLNKNKPVKHKFSPTCVHKCSPTRVPSSAAFQ